MATVTAYIYAPYSYYAETDKNVVGKAAAYAAAHNAAEADGYLGNSDGLIAQLCYPPVDPEDPELEWVMNIKRTFMYFPTSNVPEGATIDSVTLYIKASYLPDTNFVVQVQRGTSLDANGVPIVHHVPFQLADFDYTGISGDGGSVNTSTFTQTEVFYPIVFNATGRGWINTGTGAVTKLILRHQSDINAIAPDDANQYLWFYMSVTAKRAYLVIEYTEAPTVAVTTQAATELSYACGMGNGTITSGTNATERGFEIRLDFGELKDSSSGTLANYIDHSIAGFVGDVTWDIVYKWNGVLIKTESETGDFVEGAYTLVLGYPSVLGNPSSVFNDKLFKCESYTYRAYAIIDGVTYYGAYVAFDTLCDAGGDQQPSDDISDGNPTEPIIPIDIPTEPYPPFEWEFPPEIPYPPWDWDLPDLPPWILPNLPEWEMPDYPPQSFIGEFYYHKPYTKKDLDELRKKCIIYNKNSVEFALVLRHNMNVLREFFNMMTDYMDKDEFNDFTDIIPPQRLKELYLDPLEVNDFKDMINGFIRNTVDNNIAVNRNFSLIQEGLSDYETGSDDAYFRDIYSAMKTVTEDNPDVDTLKRVIDNLNQETASNFNTIMHNLEILRARLL